MTLMSTAAGVYDCLFIYLFTYLFIDKIELFLLLFCHMVYMYNIGTEKLSLFTAAVLYCFNNQVHVLHVAMYTWGLVGHFQVHDHSVAL